MSEWNNPEGQLRADLQAAEERGRERQGGAPGPRHEWRQGTGLELVVGGMIAVGFLAFLVFLFAS